MFMHWRGSPFFSGNVAAAVHIPAKTCSPTSGAPYAMDDLQGICPDCHRAKTADENRERVKPIALEIAFIQQRRM
jgi:hypothetical protein